MSYLDGNIKRAAFAHPTWTAAQVAAAAGCSESKVKRTMNGYGWFSRPVAQRAALAGAAPTPTGVRAVR